MVASSIQRRTSSTASVPGYRRAGSNSAPCGGMAATSRPIGPPTGCIVRPSRCGMSLPRTAMAMAMRRLALLIGGIAGMVWYHTAHGDGEDPAAPKADPLFNARPTPSMRATRKYFFVVVGLLLVQIGMGAITAHYAVEGQSFFGFPL